MSFQPLEPPALPVARVPGTPNDREQYSNVLRLFFNRLTHIVNGLIKLSRPSITQSTATSYTTTDRDENTIVVITNAGAIAAILHLEAPLGFRVQFQQGGTGAITLSAGAGATVVTAGSLVSAGQYSMLYATKITATQWVGT